jgi:predicted transcriptional regulator
MADNIKRLDSKTIRLRTSVRRCRLASQLYISPSCFSATESGRRQPLPEQLQPIVEVVEARQNGETRP